MNPKKSSEVKISFYLGIWALQIRFGPIGPKAFGKNFTSHQSKILALTITNMALIWPESLDESNKFTYLPSRHTTSFQRL